MAELTLALGRGAAWLGVTLLLASFLVYALTVVVPGDPALAVFRARFGDAAPPLAEQIEAIRREARFDRPLVEQYAVWLAGAVTGDLGQSFTRKRPVWSLVAERLPVTLTLTLGALLLALVLAIPAGIVFARQGWWTRAGLGATQLGISTPDYFLALVLMLVLAVHLRLFPVAGWGTPAAFVLPAATLAFRPWSTFTRLIMAGLDQAMRSDWARTGRAKGLDERTLLLRHALPHTLLPVVALVGVAASGALGAGLVAEVIFAIPGLGRLLYEAIGERDIPLIQGCLLVQVSLAVTANAAADAAMRWLNPTLRRNRGAVG